MAAWFAKFTRPSIYGTSIPTAWVSTQDVLNPEPQDHMMYIAWSYKIKVYISVDHVILEKAQYGIDLPILP